jgi:hypothetical protein
MREQHFGVRGLLAPPNDSRVDHVKAPRFVCKIVRRLSFLQNHEADSGKFIVVRESKDGVSKE